MAEGNEIGAYFLDRHDSGRFRGKLWQEERITAEALIAQIDESIQQLGYWDTYGELRMGAGPIVRIEPVDTPGGQDYIATATWGVTLAGRYKSLEQALGMLSVFASLAWDLVQGVGSDGLVWEPSDLPWPPGPR